MYLSIKYYFFGYEVKMVFDFDFFDLFGVAEELVRFWIFFIFRFLVFWMFNVIQFLIINIYKLMNYFFIVFNLVK